MIRFLWLFLILFLVLSCSAEQEDNEKATVKVAAANIFLNNDFYDSAFAEFERIFDCKVSVTLVDNSLKLHQERDSLNADVYIGFDNTMLHQVLQDSFLTEYKSGNISAIHNNFHFETNNTVHPVYFNSLAFVVKKGELDALPKTFGAIQDGSLKNKIILTNAETCAAGRAVLNWSLAAFGRNGYRHFWRSIKDNVLRIVDDKNRAFDMLLAGEAPIIIAAQTLPEYWKKQSGRNELEAIMPAEGIYNLIFYAGISKWSSNTANAQNLLDFLLSDIYQQYLQDNSPMLPVHKEILSKKSLEKLKRNRNLTDKLSIKEKQMYSADWLEKWQKIMLKN